MRRKTPQEKKELDYRKERRTGSLHGYVKGYPKTKARLNRQSRRQAETILKAAGVRSLESAVEAAGSLALTRESLRDSVPCQPGRDYKPSAYTLKEWVQLWLEGRVRFSGQRYFSEPYDSGKHRKKFARHLRTIMQGRSARSAEAASYYRELLNPTATSAVWGYDDLVRAWLRKFFDDAPHYEQLFRAWLAETEQSRPRG